ncbi:hypothetical protein CXG81DRAFT_20671 [Caulochytrium protostelioides]|uniref:Uncharacterized protein n=1 Tax=Caulochytrium protostelioides TaxID=1555241 RepID=A0A4P9WWP1_9FUNG|nr:hypothetical protein CAUPRSCDRAFT_10524 [Caulochytrium protostelioides]RKO99220.1 hypothetical protein CXG81DRAFT_20671 [Caulochytrium protostelioides]|eukprot:RKO99220.1 hypothetical protein CXG81DRAFT_20671 [Caulochytrium protostelioides]
MPAAHPRSPTGTPRAAAAPHRQHDPHDPPDSSGPPSPQAYRHAIEASLTDHLRHGIRADALRQWYTSHRAAIARQVPVDQLGRMAQRLHDATRAHPDRRMRTAAAVLRLELVLDAVRATSGAAARVPHPAVAPLATAALAQLLPLHPDVVADADVQDAAAALVSVFPQDASVKTLYLRLLLAGGRPDVAWVFFETQAEQAHDAIWYRTVLTVWDPLTVGHRRALDALLAHTHAASGPRGASHALAPRPSLGSPSASDDPDAASGTSASSADGATRLPVMARLYELFLHFMVRYHCCAAMLHQTDDEDDADDDDDDDDDDGSLTSDVPSDDETSISQLPTSFDQLLARLEKMHSNSDMFLPLASPQLTAWWIATRQEMHAHLRLLTAGRACVEATLASHENEPKDVVEWLQEAHQALSLVLSYRHERVSTLSAPASSAAYPSATADADAASASPTDDTMTWHVYQAKLAHMLLLAANVRLNRATQLASALSLRLPTSLLVHDSGDERPAALALVPPHRRAAASVTPMRIPLSACLTPYMDPRDAAAFRRWSKDVLPAPSGPYHEAAALCLPDLSFALIACLQRSVTLTSRSSWDAYLQSLFPDLPNLHHITSQGHDCALADIRALVVLTIAEAMASMAPDAAETGPDAASSASAASRGHVLFHLPWPEHGVGSEIREARTPPATLGGRGVSALSANEAPRSAALSVALAQSKLAPRMVEVYMAIATGQWQPPARHVRLWHHLLAHYARVPALNFATEEMLEPDAFAQAMLELRGSVLARHLSQSQRFAQFLVMGLWHADGALVHRQDTPSDALRFLQMAQQTRPPLIDPRPEAVDRGTPALFPHLTRLVSQWDTTEERIAQLISSLNVPPIPTATASALVSAAGPAAAPPPPRLPFLGPSAKPRPPVGSRFSGKIGDSDRVSRRESGGTPSAPSSPTRASAPADGDDLGVPDTSLMSASARSYAAHGDDAAEARASRPLAGESRLAARRRLSSIDVASVASPGHLDPDRSLLDRAVVRSPPRAALALFREPSPTRLTASQHNASPLQEGRDYIGRHAHAGDRLHVDDRHGRLLALVRRYQVTPVQLDVPTPALRKPVSPSRERHGESSDAPSVPATPRERRTSRSALSVPPRSPAASPSPWPGAAPPEPESAVRRPLFGTSAAARGLPKSFDLLPLASTSFATSAAPVLSGILTGPSLTAEPAALDPRDSLPATAHVKDFHQQRLSRHLEKLRLLRTQAVFP